MRETIFEVKKEDHKSKSVRDTNSVHQKEFF